MKNSLYADGWQQIGWRSLPYDRSIATWIKKSSALTQTLKRDDIGRKCSAAMSELQIPLLKDSTHLYVSAASNAQEVNKLSCSRACVRAKDSFSVYRCSCHMVYSFILFVASHPDMETLSLWTYLDLWFSTAVFQPVTRIISTLSVPLIVPLTFRDHYLPSPFLVSILVLRQGLSSFFFYVPVRDWLTYP